MPLLTIEQCRRQCRVDGEYDDVLLLDCMEAAVDAAASYLNRAIFEDQDALDEAWDALPAEAASATEAHSAALSAAAVEPDPSKATAMIAVADERLAGASLLRTRVLSGIAVNPSILAAVRLTMGHLYANREDVVVGATVAELPQGAKSLLRPYRKGMGP